MGDNFATLSANLGFNKLHKLKLLTNYPNEKMYLIRYVIKILFLAVLIPYTGIRVHMHICHTIIFSIHVLRTLPGIKEKFVIANKFTHLYLLYLSFAVYENE